MPSRPLPTEDLDAVLIHARSAFEELRGARIFVTGGTGFFGHWLLESLLHANSRLNLNVRATALTRNAAGFRQRAPHIADNHAITLIEGDVRSFTFPTEAHTHIVHAATDSTVSANAPAYELPETIFDGTRRVLEFARKTGAHRFLYVSSGAVYGRTMTDVARVPETYRGAPNPLELSSGYDEAKRMAEHLCVAYSHDTPLECTIARCFAFVGPHLPLDAHFAIGNFIRNTMASKPIEILGDGTPLRSYLYMSDLAAWLWTMLVRAPANRAYNVGSDQAVSIRKLAETVVATLQPGLAINVARAPTPDSTPSTYVPDISRARTELGLNVTVPFEGAIRRTAAWHGFGKR
jgi:dTDP-glucose 4,6-dehydratase